MPAGVAGEIDDEALGLGGGGNRGAATGGVEAAEGGGNGIGGTDRPTGHLRVERPALRRTRHHNELDARIVEALGQDADVADELQETVLEVAEELAPFVLRRLAADEGGGAGTGAVEDFGKPFRLLDGGGEDERPTVAGDFERRRGDAVKVLLGFHHLGEVGAVEVSGSCAALGEVKRADLDNLLFDGDEPAVVNRVKNLVVVGDGLEDLAQGLFVGPIGSGRHAEDFEVRILGIPVDATAIGRGDGMMSLVNDE